MNGAYRIEGGVLLVGSAIEAARYAVEVAQRSRARNALPPSVALAALYRVLTPAGQPDSDQVPPEQAGEQEMVATQVAAEMLQCSVRTARRLAPSLGGRLVGGRWLLDRQAVLEHMEGARRS